jgi:hypothetical protein
MKILDYAWTTFTSISGADYDRFRLILNEYARRPTMGLEGDGYVIKLPIPRSEREGIVSVQGLFADADDQGWGMLWRLFRASLYHAAFHVAHGNLKAFSGWAKGKEEFPAIYAISLLEDYRITLAARDKWPGIMGDIAYANYIGSLRLPSLDDAESRGLRAAAKLLLFLWGVPTPGDGRVDENQQVLALAEKIRGIVENSLTNPGGPLLLKAADAVYGAFERSVLPQIPAFPHTEAHSEDTLFQDHLVGGEGKEAPRMHGAMGALGLSATTTDGDESEPEFKDTYQAMIDSYANKQKLAEQYLKLTSKTRLAGVTFPNGDYSAFLRARAELAGPIRNIKNQLMTIKNVTDEEGGKHSGQVDLPMTMQVLASRTQRSDVFTQDVPLLKDEAWGILVDASKSVSKTSVTIKGIATCLAEIAHSIMKERSRWGLFGFNDKLQLVKDFDENFSIEAKARIGGLEQSGGTYIPDALAVTAHSLNMRPVESKYLVVVSDCLPTGYPGIDEELVTQVREVTKRGIMLVGIGVQSSAVKRYFRVNCNLGSPYEMMKFFVRSYLELSGTSG